VKVLRGVGGQRAGDQNRFAPFDASIFGAKPSLIPAEKARPCEAWRCKKNFRRGYLGHKFTQINADI